MSSCIFSSCRHERICSQNLAQGEFEDHKRKKWCLFTSLWFYRCNPAKHQGKLICDTWMIKCEVKVLLNWCNRRKVLFYFIYLLTCFQGSCDKQTLIVASDGPASRCVPFHESPGRMHTMCVCMRNTDSLTAHTGLQAHSVVCLRYKHLQSTCN